MLVLAPTGRDASLLCETLERGRVRCTVGRDASELCHEAEAGAGALLVAEEAMVGRGMLALGELLSRQAPWSDLPVLILAHQGANSPVLDAAMKALGNVTLVERPVRRSALISSVRAALRARARQYEIRDFLVERERSEQTLREADRRKDEFLAVLAHELRNPLAPLRNSLHLLSLRDTDAASREVCKLMERQVEHLVRLVDDLLEVSRITRGRIELRRELVQVADVVCNAIDTSRPLIEAGHHELVVDLQAEALALHADPVRMAQVFANLLNNAARYTKEGGKITVVAGREGDHAVVSVRDTGIGIAPEFLPRVFGMFVQGDSSAGRRFGGLGIGLTLVQSLVRLHGGEVEAFSAGVGRGSEFVVRLPLAPAGGSAMPEPTHERQDETAMVDVLVVDDNRDAADSLALVLRAYGADVRVAYDGPAALRLVEERSPALVLLDIGMPAMDGYEVARALRLRPGGDEMTLVALTGWGQEEDRRRSLLAGIDRHLVKPVEPGELRSLLRTL